MKVLDYQTLVVVFWLLQKQLRVTAEVLISTASIIEMMDRRSFNGFVEGQKSYEIKVIFHVYPVQ